MIIFISRYIGLNSHTKIDAWAERQYYTIYKFLSFPYFMAWDMLKYSINLLSHPSEEVSSPRPLCILVSVEGGASEVIDTPHSRAARARETLDLGNMSCKVVHLECGNPLHQCRWK